jgi:hypothetical protein
MTNKQKPDRMKLLRAAFKKVQARLTPRLLRDDRQTYNQMMAEMTRNPEKASIEVDSDANKTPGCAQRRPAPSDTDYSNMDGNKRRVEGKRSVDLNAPRSLTPEEAFEVRRVQEIVHLADTCQDAELDLPHDPGITETQNCPRCAQRTATPGVDEYSRVGKDNLFVEGRRSIDLDPVSDQTPEERIIQKQDED